MVTGTRDVPEELKAASIEDIRGRISGGGKSQGVAVAVEVYW